ncbi:hypothetical protein H310_07818 [Aphanomyces invadans]|uniref:NADH:flavin oxidoreductase/NADH oxidase N-terminal domain-containing protein n=1 Tax=Aphanomyces invadans TaxID=157072 RepID=A0A024U1J7_9STRA|nr:hypothetical protein H310_07818 [Aphanomyces invadans]ETV99766.1 hypothetical protein H310_07818 [Aphanomyces invadans]|eukprot:XP_008871542.1 hypothetical protein H310_07818 [Aphanomyces invadans]
MAAPSLFEPLQVGDYTLSHRVVLAPLTRYRASALEGDEESVPTDIMAKYYGQRASHGGLLISEASPIAPEGRPSILAPSIYTSLHAARWKPVTDAVHAKGGFIFLQLWHVGAWSHSGLDTKGRPPASSAVFNMEPGTSLFNTRDGLKPRDPQTRILTTDEIPELIQQYVRAAKLAIEAGFDGVEIHGANSYLLDQFISDHINSQRTDQYGGSLENRLRLPVEIATAVADAIGAGRTGIRFSPFVSIQGKQDSNPILTWTTLLKMLNPLHLAYVHLVEPRLPGSWDRVPNPEELNLKPFREAYDGVLIVAGGHSADTADAAVKNGDADLVAFGRSFISNPDLPSRIQHGHPFSPYDRSTFYTPGEVGYTDYKTWEELDGEKHSAAATDDVGP